MANANYEPMPFVRKFGNDAESSGSAPSAPKSAPSGSVLPITGKNVDSGFVDATGTAIMRAPVTGACRKCGFAGHLPYQCMNYLQVKPDQEVVIDVSSTSSDESDDEQSVMKKKKKKKEKKAKSKKEKKNKKEKKKERKAEKKKRKRRHSTSSDSSDSEEERRKRRKKEKKERKKKEKKRRRKSSESSTSSSD